MINTLSKVLFPVLLAGSLASFASDDDEGLVIVISPSRVPQPVHEVGSSVVLLQGDELRASGVQFVEDALLQVPSLTVSSQGARGSQVQVRARGNEANHVLVLIDGIRVSNATTGEFDFSTLSMSSVENIEILLGPQTTLYGSDAIGGVINITTKRGRRGIGGNIGVRVGELGIRSLTVGVNGANKGFHYALTAEDYSTDGISSAAASNGNTEKDPYDRQTANFKGGYSAEKFSTSIILSKTDSDFDFDSSDGTTGLSVDEKDNKQLIDASTAAWLIEWPNLGGRLNHQIQVATITNDYEVSSVFFGANSEFNTETDRDTVEYRGSFQINEDNSLQYGHEAISEALKTESISGFGNSNFEGDADQSGTYLNWLNRYNSLNIAAGVRHGEHDEFGSHSTYRLTASYQLSQSYRLKAAHGTAYKAPSLQELFDTSFGGNPNLEPEESKSSEVGIEYRENDYVVSLTYFDQDTDDLIRYSGNFPTGTNENVGKANSHGVELNVRKAWEKIELDVSLSNTKASETVNGVKSERIRIPEWAASVMTTYRYSSGRVWLQTLYRDERRDIQFTFPTQNVTLHSYTLWNIGASYRLQNQLNLSARIENLTDEDYEEVFSFGTRGRTAIVSADWVF
ncbi:MAG: vitamin B12 transporter [Gammaproteobacteria bacterium]|jgi:vitamin B12 transporter